MEYRESVMSCCCYYTREFLKKTKRIVKKIKKIWKQRKEYFTQEYWGKKVGIENSENNSQTANFKVFERENNIENGNLRLAVYTCVFGNYDKIKDPLIKGDNCDYFIITDQEISSKSVWKKIDVLNKPDGFEEWHPAIKNRYYKMHPQHIFNEYTYSLYIDGNVRPITDLYPFLVFMIKQKKEIGLFKHPIFKCLYDSATHLKNINLVDSLLMDVQTDKYRKKGFPEKYSFFECNFILRNHKNEQCCQVMETWWKEYKCGVKRDQQSFTYALWVNNMLATDICMFGDNIRESSRVKVLKHRRKHEKV